MAVLLSVVSARVCPPTEPEAAAGEAPARTHQREPEPAKGARFAAFGRGGEGEIRKPRWKVLGRPARLVGGLRGYRKIGRPPGGICLMKW